MRIRMKTAKNQRLRTFADYLLDNKIVRTQKEFAEILGKSQSQITNYLSGKDNFSKKIVMQIQKKFPSLNEDWLEDGVGEMLKNFQTTGDIRGKDNIANVHHNGNGNIEIGTAADFIEIARNLQSQLFSKDRQIAQKDEQIAEKDKQIAQRDELANRLLKMLEDLNKK